MTACRFPNGKLTSITPMYRPSMYASFSQWEACCRSPGPVRPAGRQRHLEACCEQGLLSAGREDSRRRAEIRCGRSGPHPEEVPHRQAHGGMPVELAHTRTREETEHVTDLVDDDGLEIDRVGVDTVRRIVVVLEARIEPDRGRFSEIGFGAVRVGDGGEKPERATVGRGSPHHGRRPDIRRDGIGRERLEDRPRLVARRARDEAGPHVGVDICRQLLRVGGAEHLRAIVGVRNHSGRNLCR